MIRNFNHRIVKGIALILKLLMSSVFIAPFYIAIVYSLKSQEETIATGLAWPKQIHWANFSEAIKVSNFWNATRNSVIVTVFSVVILMLACSMASYIIARREKYYKPYKWLYYVFLAALLLPFQVVMLPMYVNLKAMHLLNTRLGLVLAICAFQVAYNIFVYTGFVRAIPIEMEEAAYIDGAGKQRTFWQIVFPLLKPILSSTLILNALTVWNDFQISLIISQKAAVRTIPLTQFYFFGQYTSRVNMAFAAFVLAMIPIVVLYLLLQKYIIGGVMAGAVKG
jgi:raffinose/stachyose/melibiose transport system permease protein